jgi:hypothetical protein
MIAQNPDWNQQVAEWIANDAVAVEYQRFFRLVGLDGRAGAG